MQGVKLRVLLRAALIASACSAFAVRAPAAIYHSTFDPLGFFGDANFQVSAGCLGTDGVILNDGVTCAVNWLTTNATLTDLPSLSTRSFNFSAFLPSPTAVTAIEIVSGNHLIGVVSSPIGPVVLSGDPDPNFNGSFALDFSHDTVELARNGTLAATAHATFSVPEPKTLDLVLGALGIGWLTRCLRRRAF